MIELFVSFIYQPFLNLLLLIYWLLQQIPGLTHADMGVAIIIFSLLLRVLLLPITISATRSAQERHEIEEKIKDIHQKYPHNPVQAKAAAKQVFRASNAVIIAEIFNLTIQIMVVLMLWRIFSTGLLGKDLHLIYDFMPSIDLPLNLVFLGKYDLTHPNLILNLFQSLSIFALETFNVLTSPFPVTRKDVVRLQIILPVVSFIIFSQLPAGKKLFIITSILFSLGYNLFRQVRYFLYKHLGPVTSDKLEDKPTAA